MIKITNQISISNSELEESFIRSSGPGGQNVNKVSSGVQLRFDLGNAASIPQDMKSRAITIAGQRMTKDGFIVISATRYRTQELNRADARKRLVNLLVQAATPPKRRKPTRPTLASKRRRTDAKTRRGSLKKFSRGKPTLE